VAVAIDADVNPPPSIPLEDNYNLQAPLLIGKMGGNAVRAHPYYPHDTRLMNSRSKLLRGGDSPIVVSSRAIQEVVPTQTISRGGNTNTTFTTTTTLSSSSSSSSSPSISDSTSDLAITIFCFLIIAPCCLASIGQLIYTCHKRKRARMERQLLAVSTNPTSRMLILSEILKNDCRVSAAQCSGSDSYSLSWMSNTNPLVLLTHFFT
jgi:hypothetical protein